MILRLEHVDHVRAERLVVITTNEPAGYFLPATLNVARRALDGDVHLAQRVDELHRGGEVGLVRRDDVAARIAQLRLAQRRPARLGIVAAAPSAR